MPKSASISRAIGPGILFAGAAIGVSHLVQSTSAGARFGLWLLPAVLLAHAAKYPSMVFGPRYAAATGRSLIEGYRLQGRAALGVFALIALGTSFTILAAVTFVAASVVRTSLGLGGVSVAWVSAGMMAGSGVLVAAGGFRWLDVALKALMVILLLATLAAGVSVVPRMNAGVLLAVPEGMGWATVAVVVALMGWMPAPLDITAWHSLWTLDKAEQTGYTPTGRQCKIDFDLGFGLCVVTACSFLLLGAVVMYQSGIEPQASASAFVDQLFGLYVEALGGWVRPVIAVAASAVMISTLLTVFDALPRAAEALTAVVLARPRPRRRTRVYWGWSVAFSVGAMLIILNAREAMVPLVNLATALSFVGTPVLAWFNHRAMLSDEVPVADRPGTGMRWFSRVCVGFWTAFAVVYLIQLAESFIRASP